MALSNDGKKTFSSLEERLTDLIDVELKPNQNPIIYSSDYEVTFAGIEKWYPLDTCKGGNVVKILKDCNLLTDDDVVRPKEATVEHLTIVHSRNFLENINLPHLIEGLYSYAPNNNNNEGRGNGKFSDIASLALLPSFIVNSRLLRPSRFQTGGSVLAAKLALDFGWSINLGGGFTHCYPRRSGGFSAYADVTLTLSYLLEKVNTVMIVDLSAQQCNGAERSFMHDKRVFILDVYNRDIYPLDGFARRGISCRGELESHCSSQQYLGTIRTKLDESLERFTPDFVLYIAGCDVLVGDAGGCMNVSEEAIIERDQLVFLKFRSRGIPVAMFLGGGFSKGIHRAVAASIANLHKFGLITIASSSSVPNGLPANAKSGTGENLAAKERAARDLNKSASLSTNDLHVDDAEDKKSPNGSEVDETHTQTYQLSGFIHRSKTFMGSFLNWTKPPTIYYALPPADCLEDVASDGNS